MQYEYDGIKWKNIDWLIEMENALIYSIHIENTFIFSSFDTKRISIFSHSFAAWLSVEFEINKSLLPHKTIW